jgi:hypothetical protein
VKWYPVIPFEGCRILPDAVDFRSQPPLTRPMNNSNLSAAVAAFAKFAKRNDRRCGGMSIKRLERIIGAEIKTKGWNTSPVYFLEMFPGVSYQYGSLVRWNPRGGFNVTI